MNIFSVCVGKSLEVYRRKLRTINQDCSEGEEMDLMFSQAHGATAQGLGHLKS